MVGAAILAARAALMMGPGKVYVGIAAKTCRRTTRSTRTHVAQADELVGDEALTALAVGMGLGVDKSAPRLVSAVLARRLPTVLDADALNLIASTPGFAAALTGPAPNSSTGAPSGSKMPERHASTRLSF